MAKDTDWIPERLAEAAKQVPVPEAATTRMDALLRTLLTARPLTPTELATVAKALLAGMAMPAPKAGTEPS